MCTSPSPRFRLPIIGRDRNDSGGIWGAITDKVLARPGFLATATAALLVALAIPAFALNLGFSQGADSFHDAVDGKQALILLEEHFSSGLANPAYVVVEAGDVNTPEIQSEIDGLVAALDQDAAFVAPFNVNINRQGNLLYVEAPLAAGNDEDEAEEAIRHLRGDIIP